jgi:hypothetical protein
VQWEHASVLVPINIVFWKYILVCFYRLIARGKCTSGWIISCISQTHGLDETLNFRLLNWCEN